MTAWTVTDPTVVDARFAGGHIEVGAAELAHDPEHRVVWLRFPGLEVALFPHEARALADALNDTAGQSEPARVLRRPATSDEALREADA